MKNFGKAVVMLVAGLCIYYMISCLLSKKIVSDNNNNMSNMNKQDLESNRAANALREDGMLPHQWSEGPFYPNTIKSCSSPQMDKLDDCDVDSPNVGSNWEKYILNQ